LAPADFFETFDRRSLPTSETLRDEDGPDDFKAFSLFDDREVLVDEFDVSAVFPVKFNLDDDSNPLGRVE
jgi:hypothetical protein